MKRCKLFVVVVGAAALIAIQAIGTPVLAQGGNVGGRIGKTDKSVIGDQTAPPSRTPAKRKRTATPATGQETRKSTACGNFFGTWTSGGGAWLYGPNDTVIRADGTARHNSGIVGTWNCSGGEIVLEWKGWTTDRLKLSADGKHLNSVVGGKGFTR